MREKREVAIQGVQNLFVITVSLFAMLVIQWFVRVQYEGDLLYGIVQHLQDWGAEYLAVAVLFSVLPAVSVTGLQALRGDARW